MPRPPVRTITFSLDGREVTAPEGIMLVDGAKYGDVEIPVFCYEPKLGAPVGACRMCLVEIEGIPKLQTACSTPVKDGMVVHTQTARVHEAQKAVLEFLLINHPLDCPVCDKGGECPLQDISYGWGPGTSRFIEPKRHFKKPLALSPLVAIDRERCILCYRCVRFSQEVSEDYQLVLHDRGAHTYVGTFDGHPYVAPFSGNIIELCVVGALTSSPYRFRARPWDVVYGGSVCTLCPAQCNVQFTVRDDRVMRVMARDNAEVDDGWLCDKGRFAYQHVHVEERIREPLLRDGGELRPVSWDRALQAGGSALKKAGGRIGALAAGSTTNEEAHLFGRLVDGVGGGLLAARPGGELPDEIEQVLYAPALQASVEDLEFAHTVLVLDTDPIDDAPILDLRLRKGARRRGVRLAVATARPSALDPSAALSVRFAPGAGEALLYALDCTLAGAKAPTIKKWATAAGATPQALTDLAALLTEVGQDVVVVYGERLLGGPRGARAARALLNVAARLGLAGRAGAGLLEIPSSPNGRGLREAGFSGTDAHAIAQGLAAGELSTLVLLRADPVATHADRPLWERALSKATTVIAVDTMLSDALREHADIVFPADAYAEQEGTVVHPDGRLQRLRPAIGRPGSVRAGWSVIADVARHAGVELDVVTGAAASAQLFAAIPGYAGLTLEGLGGKGVRWPAREPAASWPVPELARVKLEAPPAAASPNGALRLGSFRPLWASKEVAVSPSLKFLTPTQTIELSVEDAQRLGVVTDDRVAVASDGRRVEGTAIVRSAVPAGTVFVAEGAAGQPANVFAGTALVEVTRVGGPEPVPVAHAVAASTTEPGT